LRNAALFELRIAGRALDKRAGFTDERAAGVTLEVSGVARMALFTADRWLIKDFF
jgi:hypothetical protein